MKPAWFPVARTAAKAWVKRAWGCREVNLKGRDQVCHAALLGEEARLAQAHLQTPKKATRAWGADAKATAIMREVKNTDVRALFAPPRRQWQ